MEFKKFYFEGNMRWGHMNNQEDLNTLLEDYPYETLKQARRLGSDMMVRPGGNPSFGFYSEYNDSYTLGDWVEENNLQEFFIKS